MWSDLLTALGIYGGAMGALAAVAYYLHWEHK